MKLLAAQSGLAFAKFHERFVTALDFTAVMHPPDILEITRDRTCNVFQGVQIGIRK
jgi:hypothetical protein